MTPAKTTVTGSLTVALDRAVLALSDALDFIGVDEIGHGHRVALMAGTVATALGWPEETVRDAVRAGLMHDCGVSSTREHKHLIDEIAWEGERAHCERGFDYLSAVPALAWMAPVVLEHHTPWQDLQRRGIDPAVARMANLIYLCDRVDAVRARGVEEGRPVIDVLSRYQPTHFAPEIFAVLAEEARSEAFWFAQEDPSLRERVAAFLGDGKPVMLGVAALKGLASVFGRIIDAKSPYTERHSVGVARLARYLGTRFKLSPDSLDMLEVAGLLHDLGKLRIPDELLDKTGPLSGDERRRMARHAFDTYEILHRIFGDGPVAEWAAYHHEYVSGRGYPFHREGEGLPLEARIIAVADVFQALAQKRPYRDPLDAEEIGLILDGMVFGGKLDRNVVAVAKEDLEACRREAMVAEGV